MPLGFLPGFFPSGSPTPERLNMAKTTKKKSPLSVLKTPDLGTGYKKYLSFQDRPPYPDKNSCDDWIAWLGWMLARSEDVWSIIEECGMDPKKFKQRVAHLDKAHGLTGRWDKYPR
jgi:hypothetical protein